MVSPIFLQGQEKRPAAVVARNNDFWPSRATSTPQLFFNKRKELRRMADALACNIFPSEE
jgi:hypothetical protein